MARFDWTRDELILALDLYFAEPTARGSKTHPGVHALSALLNNLPIHPLKDRRAYFRNPNGVGMKLGNFLRFDPDYDGEGLPRGGKLDEEIWNEFHNDKNRLRRVAEAIRRTANLDELRDIGDDESEITEATEGKILTRLHKTRERSRKLVQAKKDAVLKKTGHLACEACGFDFAQRYGVRGKGFAECHHLLPVEELDPGSRTRLSDLAIVCANCHRMIHRKRPWLTLDGLRRVLSEQRI